MAERAASLGPLANAESFTPARPETLNRGLRQRTCLRPAQRSAERRRDDRFGGRRGGGLRRRRRAIQRPAAAAEEVKSGRPLHRLGLTKTAVEARNHNTAPFQDSNNAGARRIGTGNPKARPTRAKTARDLAASVA